jgi:hypothetical protein
MDIKELIDKMPEELREETARAFAFSMPWQTTYPDDNYDPDRPKVIVSPEDEANREQLQTECWQKYHRSPQLNTAVRGMVGRLTGWGFSTTSEVFEIDEVVREIQDDPRNNLPLFWPKYVGRAFIEGELFLCLTLHTDSFVEVDFFDPISVKEVVYHPTKALMPLLYKVEAPTAKLKELWIPSIYVARYIDLLALAKKLKNLDNKHFDISDDAAFSKFAGHRKFIVSWDRGMMTKRSVSYLRTVLEWLNHYDNLKKFEIDHKKSVGSYVWNVGFEDMQSFLTWLSLTDEERRKTGIMAKKTPGSTIIRPPGMTLEAVSPKLPNITNEDTDILHMVSAGLNEPEDVMTGQSKGTFASVKASRGPMSDRVSDEISLFHTFLKFFWSSIFFLKSSVSIFKDEFKVRECTGFTKSGEPVFALVKRKPEELVDISFPVSETIDMESRARAVLGVKHGPLAEVLGIPYSEGAKKLGFGNYGYQRRKQALEKEKYPELDYTADQESIQEKALGGPGRVARPIPPQGGK